MLSFFSSLLLRSHLELHLFTSHHSSSGASSGALVNQVVACALHLTPLLVVPEPVSCGDQNRNQFQKRSALGHGPRAVSHACWRKLVHPVDFHGYSLNGNCFAGFPFTFEALTSKGFYLFCPPKCRQFTQDLDVGGDRKAQRRCWTRYLQRFLPSSPVFQPSCGTLWRGSAIAGGFGPSRIQRAASSSSDGPERWHKQEDKTQR